MYLPYTAFPTLRHVAPTVEQGSHNTLFAYNNLFVPEEVLYIAWAHLLRSYTAEDVLRFAVSPSEDLVFHTADQPSSKVPAHNRSDQSYTGVFNCRESPAGEPPPELFLHHDVVTGLGTIYATPRLLPQIHLYELKLQFRLILSDRFCCFDGQPILPPKLSILNPTPRRIHGPCLVHDLLKQHASSDSIAVEHLDSTGLRHQISYAELERRSSAFSRHIKSVLSDRLPLDGRQALVPVLISQSLDLFVSLLAILKAGAAFCPISLDAPPDRIKFIIEDLGAKLFITTTEHQSQLPENVDLQTLFADLAKSDTASSLELTHSGPSSADISYCMFTSGSTGSPKGVLLSHSAVTQSLLAHNDHIPQFRRFLQFATTCFDVSMFEIFFTFFRGATLVSCSRPILLENLPDAMERLQIDAAELTPTVAGTLLSSRNNAPSLRCLLTIGEMLSKTLIDEFGRSSLQPGILHAMYGPTEVAIHCTMLANMESSSKPGSIGRPLDTVSTFIMSLHPRQDVLPIGHVGELVCGGMQLANEYLNRPESTALAFINHEEFGRLYRTGDKCRMLADGTLEIMGRISEGQVKLRGQRIELGEIEYVASHVSSVASSVAMIVHDNLVLFALRRDASASAQRLLDSLRKTLPQFMIPSDVVMLDDLPRLVSGKIDKTALEGFYLRRRNASDVDAATESSSLIERQICETVKDILGRSVGLDTDLHAAGLDSLKAIRFTSLIRAFGLSCNAVEVLLANTIRSVLRQSNNLATREFDVQHKKQSYQTTCSNLRETLEKMRIPGGSLDEIEDVFPPTPLQLSLLAESTRENHAYCNSINMSLPPSVSVLECREAFHKLVQNNEILRSGFVHMRDPRRPYIGIIWKGLSTSQLIEVPFFSQHFSLATEEDQSRPFKIQLKHDRNSNIASISIHHALYDGWSWDLILDDLRQLLHGCSAAQRPQFREIAAYQHSLGADSSFKESDKQFWSENLAGAEPVPLPNLTGRQPEDIKTYREGGECKISLQKLRTCAANVHCHPQVILQVAFSILLGQYLGKRDVIMGTVSSGRTVPIPGIEHIVGPCITTLPLRINIAPEANVRSILRKTQAQNRQLLAHGVLPLHEIKSSAQIEPGNPLFETLVVWQETLFPNRGQDGPIEQMEYSDYVEHKILLEYEPKQSTLQCKLTFKSSVLNRAQAKLFLRQMDALANALMDSLHTRIGEIPDLLHQDLTSLVNFPHESCRNKCRKLSAAVEEHAVQNPNDTALEFAHELSGKDAITSTLNYADLNKRANRLAYALVTRGVLPNDVVCICLDKCLDLYICILATVKAGAGYLPISPDAPNDRLSFMLGDSNTKLALSTPSIIDKRQVLKEASLLDITALDFSTFSHENLDLPFMPENVAYVIYTSGSTGTPKGLAVTQLNLASHLLVLADQYPVVDLRDPKMLQSCSQAFDVSVFEIFFSWHRGLCLSSAPNNLLYRDLEATIRTLRITHLSMTPTVASLVDPDHVPSVEFLVTAGEAMTGSVFRKWADRGLWQGYGPSETTNICSVQPRVTGQDSMSLVGPPFRNTSAFVISTGEAIADCRPLLLGGLGELCFGGDQVFRGYLDVAQDEGKLANHSRYGRIYRSGDLGRITADGSILISGRVDDQVKIRGQRVEIGEVNKAVMGSPKVRDSVTVVIKSGSASMNQLVSFVALQSTTQAKSLVVPPSAGIRCDIDDIQKVVKSNLPAYMCPSMFLPISNVPMTAQTKVDKRSLLAEFEKLDHSYFSALTQEATDVDTRRSWLPLEREVSRTLSSIIGVPEANIDRRMSLYAYGIDSLSAITLAHSLRHETQNKNVDASMILQNATVTRLAERISETDRQRFRSLQPQITPDKMFSTETLLKIRSDFPNASKILPVTPLQEAVLAADTSYVEGAYCNTTIFRIKEDPDSLRRAWSIMANRAEILRTVFVQTYDREYAFAQVVLDHVEVRWTTKVFDDLGLDSLQKSFRELRDTTPGNSAPHFQLTHAISKTQPRDSRLVLSMHHALYDGIAFSLLLKEVEKVVKNDDRLLPRLSFEPFLQKMIAAQNNESETFWKRELSGFEPNSFPDLTGLPTAQKASPPRTSVFTKPLSVPLTVMDTRCKEMHTTILSIFQTAWAKLLSAYLGENDLCFGNVLSGRTLPVESINDLIAPCFNTVPVRIDLQNYSTTSGILTRMRDFNAEVLAHQFTPLRRIQSWICDDQQHLFDSLLILQQGSIDLDDHIWQLEHHFGEMDVPVVCEIVPSRLSCVFDVSFYCHSSVLREADIPAMFDTFEDCVRSCIEQPLEDPRSILKPGNCLLSSMDFKNFSLDADSSGLVHQSILETCRKFPENMALDFLKSDGLRVKWTYDELDYQSARILKVLLRTGIRSEESIPIVIPKSPLFYATVLGVLRSGAAFTPIDDEAPSNRKRLMIEQLGSRLILSCPGVDTSWCPVQVIDVDVLRESEDAQRYSAPFIGAGNLAYRIYTSGSTGTPKAVNIEHRNAMQTIASSRTSIEWSSETRLLNFAATSFDMCYYDIFMAWSFGFCLCAASKSRMFNDLSSVINEMGITMLDLTPSMASTLKPSSVPSVQYLYCIGETMRSQLVSDWNGRCVNSYGPTEAAMCVSIFPTSTEVKASIIGKPFTATIFLITRVDSQVEVPSFGAGELCIGGDQVARGYFANDELTKRQFFHACNTVFYKTGDLVRKLADGNYEYLGRIDDQVKIRGLRVELEEINVAIKRSSRDVVAVSTQVCKVSQDSKDQLVAFVAVGNDRPHLDGYHIEQKAREDVSRNLPAYMQPQAYHLLADLPRSSAGKIDKKALIASFRESLNAVQEDRVKGLENSLSADEKAVCSAFAAFADETRGKTIRRSTSIYQLGLDSITATQIAARLRQDGYQCSAIEVVESPTVQQLAQRLTRRDEQFNLATHTPSKRALDFGGFFDLHISKLCAKIGVKRSSIADLRPCTPLQSGMIAQFLHSQGQMYFNHIEMCVDKEVDLETLNEAWDIVFERHEILRSGFACVEDQHYPFGMITYRPRCARLPLDKINATEDKELHDAISWHRAASGACLSAMHEPPWRVCIVVGERTRRMLFSAHHALYDAHVLSTIFQDLHAAYSGTRILHARPIEPAISHVLTSARPDDATVKNFWAHLCKSMVPTKFPNMTNFRVEKGTKRVASRVSSFDVSELETCSRKIGVTAQVFGQAAWARILSEYVGENSVTFGTVSSGRSFEDADKLAMPLIVTLPTSVQMLDQIDDQILRQIMRSNTDVQRYQFTSMTQIQRYAGRSEESLFDTIFAYQKGTRQNNKNSFPWHTINEDSSVDYAVSIELEPSMTDRLDMRLTFLDDVLPVEQARILLDQLDASMRFFMKLEKTAQNGGETMSNVHSVIPSKKQRLSSHVQLLHQFVEDSATCHAPKTALEFATDLHGNPGKRERWTYMQLNEQGNAVANSIRSLSISQSSLVAVCFEKCPQASFAILGILKAGCGFLAIDPGAPEDRKAFIIQDSGATAILTTSALSVDFQESSLPVICLDETIDLTEKSKQPPALDRPIDSDDMSYCLYTSGTTGRPKGCAVTHDNAVQAMLAFQTLFRWETHSRFMQFASFHFDVSVMEQYWSWSVGICCVSAPRDLVFEDLAASIRQLGITHIDLTPSLAKTLEVSEVPALCGPNSVFITGGEALQQEIIDAWGPKGVIYNGYGPTEATIGCTMHPRVPANASPSNIGPPFQNAGAFVFRPGTNQLVFRGAVGELCISGPLVAKGYLNRPELTRERFQSLPSGERVYRTGDLVRLNHDGAFTFVGRTDDQVKLRGQRLEIGEVNNAIKEGATEISETVTLVATHPRQQKKQLISFVVVPMNGSQRRRLEICSGEKARRALGKAKEHCQSKLPGYMVPTHFVPLTMLPLTANNKADAKRLKELYSQMTTDQLQRLSSSLESKPQAMTAAENKVATVLRSMLPESGEFIGRHSNIFSLGLDSISAINFGQALKTAGFAGAQSSVIMQNHTVALLAKEVEKGNEDDDGSLQSAKQDVAAYQYRHKYSAAKALNTDPSEIACLAPCTPLQQGILLRSLRSDRPIYHADFRFDLTDDADLKALHGASQRVQAKVEVLRTRFVSSDSGHLQVALRQVEIPWAENMFATRAEADQFLHESHLSWWRQDRGSFQRPFEIVIATCPGRRTMALHMLHAIYDGNSLPLLLNCFLAEYHGKSIIKYGPSFQASLPYGPLRKQKDSQKFWKQHLHNVCTVALHPMIPGSSDQDALVIEKIHTDDLLEATRRSLGVTHQALVQTAWIAVLQHFFEGAITVGLLVSGRSIDFEDAQNVIGPLFNTLPFHLRLSTLDSWSTAVKRCHDFNTDAAPFQHTALRDILKWCGQRSTSSNPLFETVFVFQKEGTPEHQLRPPWTAQGSIFEADYPLAFEAEQALDGGLSLTLAAQKHIGDEQTLRNFLQCFRKALRYLSTDPNGKIAEVFDVGKTLTDQSLANSINDHQDDCLSYFHWTPDSVKLRDVIAHLIDADPSELDPKTSIFQLGLDSIDAMKVSSMIKKVAKLSIPVSIIMRHPTIAGMASRAKKANDRRESNKYVEDLRKAERELKSHFNEEGLNLANVEEVLPTTPLQDAVLVEMIDSDHRAYFNHDVLKLDPCVDEERLRHAWQHVVDESPILRTGFAEVGNSALPFSFAQLVHRKAKLQWETLKYDEYTALERILETIAIQAAELPLTVPRIRLTTASERNDHSQRYLILSIAHALYDGYSLNLVHSDVRHAYHGLFRPTPSYHPLLSEILHAASSKDSESFWQESFRGITKTIFPKRQDGRTKHLGSNETHRQELRSQIPSDKLNEFCRSMGITIGTLAQLCWILILASRTKKVDVAFGVVLSGRDDEAFSSIRFPAMNTIVARSMIHGSKQEMLEDTQEHMAAFAQHQRFPLRKALASAEVSGHSLFDTLFIFQRQPEASKERDKIGNLYQSVGGASDVEYSVCVEAEVIDGLLYWRDACKDSILDREGSFSLLDQLDSVLQDIVLDPQAPAVTFEGPLIRICNTVPFQLEAREESIDPTTGKREGSSKEMISTTDSAMSHHENAVRKAVATAANIPDDEVKSSSTLQQLGLDSISAIKVSSSLRKQGLRLRVSDMMRARNISAMSSIAVPVDGASNEAKDEKDPLRRMQDAHAAGNFNVLLQGHGFQPDDVEDVLPATAGQEYMTGAWQNHGLFFSTFSYKIIGPIRGVSEVQSAWKLLVDRQPILRTVLVSSVGSGDSSALLQIILRNVNQFDAILGGTEKDRGHQIGSIMSPRTPMVSLRVCENSDHSYTLRLNIHHALYDGVSLDALIGDFRFVLWQHVNQTHAERSDVPLESYKNFIGGAVGEQVWRDRKQFWTWYLNGTPGSTPSALVPTKDIPNAKGRRTEHFNPNFLPATASLSRAARARSLSLSCLFLAAYAQTHAALRQRQRTFPLGHTSNDEDFLLGTYLSNRTFDVPELPHMPYPTVSLVPLRIRSPLSRTITQIARDVQDDITGITENIGRAQTRLWEMREWTSVDLKVEAWVNFLRVPQAEEEVDAGGRRERQVHLEEIESARGCEGYARVVELDEVREAEAHSELARFVEGNNVRGVYSDPAIDIEAAVTAGEGGAEQLSVGVFGEPRLLPLDEAGWITEELRRRLEQFCENGS